jgi:protein TonB
MPLSKDDAPRGALRVGRTAGITQPSRTVYVRPIYPDRAKAQGIKGIVILEALIDRQGTVRSTQILRSIPLLDQAAADAVCQWQFSAAVVNGDRTATALTITVNFPPGENAP